MHTSFSRLRLRLRSHLLLCVCLLVVTSMALVPHAAVMGQKQQCGNGTEPGTFDRIMIVMFENRGYIETMWQSFFKKLANNLGTNVSKYYGITHPSQPNYLTQIAGDHFGEKHDSNIDLPHSTLIDLLEKRNVTWKSYQEDYPIRGSGGPDDDGWNDAGCFVKRVSSDRLYFRKHNPMMSFTNISTNPARCRRIVNSNVLYDDIKQRTLPQFMYFTPNINNDGHDTGLKHANAWLEKFLTPLLADRYFMNGTMVFVTFDEDLVIEFNHVYAAAVGPMCTPGFKDTNRYNHYSLLRTVEDNWQLGTLGRNDDKAVSFKCLNKRTKYIYN